jgi:hypothetical protein
MTAARKTIISFLLVSILLLVSYSNGVHAQNTADVFILSDDITSDNQRFVSLQFTVRDENGFGELGLSPASIELSEPSDNLTLVAERSQGIDIAMVVDLSVGSNIELIKETMRSYFLNYFRDGDKVTLYFLAGDERQPIEADVQTRERALGIIEDIPEQENVYSLEDPLTFVLADFRTRESEDYSPPRHILHIASSMSFPEETMLSAPFNELGIPILLYKHTQPKLLNR